MATRTDRLRQAQSDQKTGDTLRAFLLMVVTAFPLALWQGFVVKTIWNWFVPLALPGTPRLAVWTAFGLALFVGLFMYHKEPEKGQSLVAFIKARLFDQLNEGVVALVMGAIVHWFMR